MSIIGLPTKCTAPAGLPSRARYPIASGDVTNSSEHSWSVSRLLISSGMVSSKLRSPASTCASGTPSLAPASDAPIVEFTSPYTTASAGGVRVNSSSMPTMTSAVCLACVPDPTPRLTSGRGRPSCTKKISDMRSS